MYMKIKRGEEEGNLADKDRNLDGLGGVKRI